MTARRKRYEDCEDWDLSELDGCLPRSSAFSDIDAWTEISGSFLFIERKQTLEKYGAGHLQALRRLSGQPDTTVIERRSGFGDKGREILLRAFPAGEELLLPKSGLEDFRAWVAEWGRQADAKKAERRRKCPACGKIEA